MTNKKKEQSYKSMLMFGLFSIVMLFAGLTSAYIVSKGYMGSQWQLVPLPQTFLYSTIIIFLSSITLFLSNKNLKNDNSERSKQYLLLTIILGFLFFVTQYLGWKSLVNDGYFFVVCFRCVAPLVVWWLGMGRIRRSKRRNSKRSYKK